MRLQTFEKHLVAPLSAFVLSRFPLDLLSVRREPEFAEAGLRVRGGSIADPIAVTVSQSGHPVIFLASDKSVVRVRKIVSRSKRRRFAAIPSFPFPRFSFCLSFFFRSNRRDSDHREDSCAFQLYFKEDFQETVSRMFRSFRLMGLKL